MTRYWLLSLLITIPLFAENPNIHWNNGTIINLPKSGITTKINTEIRSRYEYQNSDTETRSGVETKAARLILRGNILNQKFSYYTKTDFARSQNKLRDAWLSWNKDQDFSFKLGQFKSLISKQYITSSRKLQFADRSIASNHFFLNRQAGLHASYQSDFLTLNGQILNGQQLDQTNEETDHTYVITGRVPLSKERISLEEGDSEHSNRLAADLGFAYAYNKLPVEDEHIANIDLNLKFSGFSFHSEIYTKQRESNVEDFGYYIQSGYYIIPKKLELAARYSYLNCDASSTGDCKNKDKIHELSTSLNYHWLKHNLKTRLGFSYITEEELSGEDTDDKRALVQLIGYF